MSFYRRAKNIDKPILSQVLKYIPRYLLNFEIRGHQSDKSCSKYKTYDQLVALTFGQLNKCYTLSDISCGLSISDTFLSNIGLSQRLAKSTMSDGNKNRDYRVFESLHYKLLNYHERGLEKQHKSHYIKQIKNHTIKSVDSSTVSLCLKIFDWAKFRAAKGGIKLHTVWDDQ